MRKKLITFICLFSLLFSAMAVQGEEFDPIIDLELNLEAEGLNQPQGLCSDANGTIYIADTYNNTINVLSAEGIVKFAGLTDKKDIFGFYQGGLVDGNKETARFNRPRDIVADSEGVLYVADTENHVIRKIENDIVTTIAGNGMPGYINGLNYKSKFNMPSGITIDENGILYVADTLNNAIRTIDKEGNVSTLILKSKIDGAQVHSLNEPSDLCFDSEGILYILDAGNQLVKKVTEGYVEIVAGLEMESGNDGYVEDDYIDGNVNEAKFSFPKSIVVHDGNIYVADTWNHTIRVIKKDQQVVTIAGNGEPGYESDIRGSSLNGPSGLMVYDGKLFVSDRWNDEIKSIPLEYGAQIFDLELAMPKLDDSDEIKVIINNEVIVYDNAKPYSVDESAYYPIRIISESLGAKVSYDKETETATINYKNREYSYWIYADNIMLNNSRSYINIRELATNLGFFVTIDNETKDVLITEIP